MRETYYAASYWLGRSESAEVCARRAERFFHLLGRCDPAWSHWYETAASFDQARNLQARTDALSFQKLFAREGHGIDDGFSFGLWTGDNSQETSGVNGRCGSIDDSLPAHCVLRPYKRGPIAERVLTAPVMTDVLRAMALSWEPEWGVVASHQHLEMMATQVIPPGTFVGWVMYFSRLRGAVPSLPTPVRVEAIEDKGTLVILTPERFTASNPEHVELAAHVHELLNQAGLLRRLQPADSQ